MFTGYKFGRSLFSKLVLSFFIICLSVSYAQGVKKLSKAPNFSAPNLDGEKVELKTLLQQGPILISFWATHCKPCIKELNQLKKFYPEYKKKGFELLAVDVDGPRSVSRVKSKVKGLKWKFPVLLDTNRDIYRKYHVLGIPHTVLIDQEGNIRYTHTTYRSGDEKIIKKKIEKLFDEQKEVSEQKEEKEGKDSEK
jgi:cytochrome c biogenesis protein CcmG/thiol:disulfide interchange protein DsbE